MLPMFIKDRLRQLLPPPLTMRLIAHTNYKSGEPELKLLKDLVNPQKNSIDIGANKGSYTYFLRQLSQHVFAYEPNPELAKFLDRAIVGKSNISVYQIALSDRTGVAQLSIPIVDTYSYSGASNHRLPMPTCKLLTYPSPV
jgi:hypothetical protein